MGNNNGYNSIFILQTRRLGDFFQSIPLIEALTSPGGTGAKNIGLLIDENIYNIKNIFNAGINFFTYESLLKSHGISAESLSEFNLFLSDFTSECELAVNLNYDFTNSLFLNFFKEQKRGFIALDKSTKTAESISRSAAANYLFNIVKNRSLNRINIVDIYSLVGSEKPAEIKTSYNIINLKKQVKNKKALKDGEPLRICISIGATHPKRIWQSKNYANLIKLLSESLHCEVILVGTAEESSAAEEIKKNLPLGVNIIDLTGKTNLSELIYLIKDFHIIIASDTGTLHIAQIFNVPSVSVFTGNANFYETGPHIENSYVIYSKIECYPCLQNETCRFNYACKNDINPENVFELVLLQVVRNKLYSACKDERVRLLDIKKRINANVRKGNFSVAVCKHMNSIHFYPTYKRKINKDELASEILKFCWINVLSKNNVKIDKNNVLRYTNKYYKINRKSVDSLIREISFIKTVFENGRKSFGSEESLYFEKFQDAVKSFGLNYSYLKLACDYFIDELNSSGAPKSFNDIILLLDNVIKILKMF